MRDYKVYVRSGSEGWLRDLLFLLLLFSVPFLASLGRLPLFGPYEGAYAEISRAMLERGDLITTSLDHLNRFGNPPLLFWLNAASLAFFGQNEFSVRFPTALCGLLTLPAVYVIARRLYDRRTALLSAILLGSCTGFALLSRGILTQLPLCLCLTAALGSFVVAGQRDEPSREASGHWYPFYLFWALAVLAGGMVGILLPAAVILVYLLLAGRWELLPRMRCGSGLLLFLMVAAPWFVAVWLESPGSVHLLPGQGIGRYGVSLAEDRRPFWLVVPLLVAGLLPWSCYVLPALSRAWREQGRGGGRSRLFLMIWALAILLFFVLSGSRPIPALLPAFPPLAILAAHLVKGELERRGRGLRLVTRLQGAVMALLGVAALAYPLLLRSVQSLAALLPAWGHALERWAEHAPRFSPAACMLVAGLLLLQGIMSLAVSERRTGRALIVLCLCSFALEIIVPRQIMGTIARAESPRALAVRAVELAGADTAIVTLGPLHGVSWYAGRPVPVVGTVQQDLAALWSGTAPLLVILEKGELDALLPSLRPAPRILMESGPRLLISNR
jgi:4-amino-4-deoxy-L-arabinose transferase-like glycosyltransferase